MKTIKGGGYQLSTQPPRLTRRRIDQTTEIMVTGKGVFPSLWGGLAMATPAILSHRVTRILIVDDHPLMREGLGARIAQQPDLEVCGEADSVTSALAQVRALHPDMVLVDIQLPDSNGIAAADTPCRGGREPSNRSGIA